MNILRISIAAAFAAATLSACGGGAVEGPGPNVAATASPTASGATASPGASASPSAGATASPSAGATATATAGATASPTAGTTATPTAAATASPTATPAPTATPTITPTPGPVTTTTPAGTKIYVVNHTKTGATGQTPSITVYPATASGNVAPVQTIAGPATGLDVPQFIAIDSKGDIWVTNEGTNLSGSVEEFAPNADNNSAPIAKITGLNTPEGIFIDAAGDIYIDTVNTINEYAPGTTGNAPTPMKTIGAPANGMTNNTTLAGPYGLRVNAAGSILVAQEEAIYVFAASASGNVAPNQSITGQAALFASDLDVAYDATGNIYCTNFNMNTINEYAPTATGAMTTPSGTVTSTNLSEPIGLAFDSTGIMYVANYGNNSVLILPAGSTGAAIGTVISGAATGLSSPYGIAVH